MGQWMKITNADTGPEMTLVVTDTERSIAKEVKSEFKDIVNKLDKSIKSVTELRVAIVEKHPTRDQLKTKYRGRLLRYRRKIQTVFNELLLSVKHALEKLADISDPDMLRLREILVAEVGELSDGAEAILDLLKEPDKEDFTKTLEKICAQLEKRQKSIKDVIDNQLFGHINHDILGKMKISELQFKIRRRSRILKQLVKGK
jgi:hypothetical protein